LGSTSPKDSSKPMVVGYGLKASKARAQRSPSPCRWLQNDTSTVGNTRPWFVGKLHDDIDSNPLGFLGWHDEVLPSLGRFRGVKQQEGREDASPHPPSRRTRRLACTYTSVIGALVAAARLLRIAVSAVDGPVGTRQERDLGGLAAAAAHNRMHHARLASLIDVVVEAPHGRGSSLGPAGLATLRAA